jgi:hypothetical protein
MVWVRIRDWSSAKTRVRVRVMSRVMVCGRIIFMAMGTVRFCVRAQDNAWSRTRAGFRARFLVWFRARAKSSSQANFRLGLVLVFASQLRLELGLGLWIGLWLG